MTDSTRREKGRSHLHDAAIPKRLERRPIDQPLRFTLRIFVVKCLPMRAGTIRNANT
jgi:hypothetical protein